MVVMVLSKVGHALSHSVLGSSLAGDGLLVRIRSTSIALFGLVTVIGLGLVVFISQQGWPGAFSSPIPANPPKLGTVHDAVALNRSSPPAGSPSRAGGSSRRAIHARESGAGRGSRSSASSGLHQTHQVAGAPHAGQPTAPSGPEPAVPSPEASPAPTPNVVNSPAPGSADQPQGSSPSQSKSTASSPGVAKSNGSGKDKGYSHKDSKETQIGKAKGHSASPSKSKSDSPGKSAKSHGAPASPAPEPVTKEAAPEGGYGGGKDPGYTGKGNGKSGKGDH